MAITTLDGLIAAAKQNQPIYKNSMTTKAAAAFHSLWTATGMPGAGAAAGSAAGAACTNATAGAITLGTFSLTGYLAALDLSCSVVGQFILYDRLVHTSALVGNVATAQTVNSAALTRYTTGDDVECWIEVYTATGATPATATVSYTNQAGTAGRTGTAAIVATTVAGQIFPVALQAGDTGVRSVQSVTLSISTGTAGNFGITLMRRLATYPIPQANVGGPVLDWGALGLPALDGTTPCLALALLCSAATSGNLIGSVKTAEG